MEAFTGVNGNMLEYTLHVKLLRYCEIKGNLGKRRVKVWRLHPLLASTAAQVQLSAAQRAENLHLSTFNSLKADIWQI